MAIDDTAGSETGADSPASLGGADGDRPAVRERRETTQTVTDSYVVLTRRLIRTEGETADSDR